MPEKILTIFSRVSSPESVKRYQRRLVAIGAVLVLLAAVIVGRLVHLQVILSDEYRQIARKHLVTDEFRGPRRGRILTSDGLVLADTRQSFNLTLRIGELRLTFDSYRAVLDRYLDMYGDEDEAVPARRNRLRGVRTMDDFREFFERRPGIRSQFPKETEDANRDAVKLLSRLLTTSEDKVVTRIARALRDQVGRQWLWNDTVQFENVDVNAVMAIDCEPDRCPGVYVMPDTARRYPVRLAPHIVGYVQKVSPEEHEELLKTGRLDNRIFLALDKIRDDGGHTHSRSEQEIFEHHLWQTMEVGVSGMERRCNDLLRGRLGECRSWWTIDRTDGGYRSRKVPWDEIEARPGEDLKLTIDSRLQRIVENVLSQRLLLPSGHILDPKPAAAVFLDPKTGAVLALVSLPDYDVIDIKSAQASEQLPFVNRAIAGCYPLGSCIKPILAVGALSQGTITPETEFVCEGRIVLGKHKFRCLGVHGTVAVHRGIVKSCNSFFYQLSREMQADGLSQWGLRFGLGQRTGIDLPGELKGFYPTPGTYSERFPEERWYPGNQMHVSIGQGSVSVTPLQVAAAMAALANGGNLPRPFLKAGTTPHLEPIPGLTPEALKLVHEAMTQVMWPGGTGERYPLEKFTMAGKTGSAEIYHSPTHSWFAGYAPAVDPAVAFAVIVERAGHGNEHALPVVKTILDQWLPNVRQPDRRKEEEVPKEETPADETAPEQPELPKLEPVKPEPVKPEPVKPEPEDNPDSPDAVG